jgi:DNA adenine methylase
MGGKTFSAERIIAKMPAHTCYVEAFAGGAQVFFRKPRARVEVINDLDSELLNFYRCVQTAPWRVARIVSAMPHSRVLYNWLRQHPWPEFQRYRRAARFWYLQRTSFAGKVVGQSFGYAKCRPSRQHPVRVERELKDAAERLHTVTLECGPWQTVVDRYDGPETLFYLDPPYVDLPYYRHNFTEADHREMSERLRKLAGRFMLSYNDHPLIRTLYAWARIEALEVPYCIKGAQGRAASELLITGP